HILAENDNDSSDSSGIRVAHSTFAGGALGSWESPSSGILISDSFMPPLRDGNSSRFYDQVDIAIMPEKFVDNTAYSGIGCAFISGKNLILAESHSTSGSPDWIFHSIATGGTVIDEGNLYWVKLVYVSEG